MHAVALSLHTLLELRTRQLIPLVAGRERVFHSLSLKTHFTYLQRTTSIELDIEVFLLYCTILFVLL